MPGRWFSVRWLWAVNIIHPSQWRRNGPPYSAYGCRDLPRPISRRCTAARTAIAVRPGDAAAPDPACADLCGHPRCRTSSRARLKIPHAQALGLGLMLPGGGFLAHAGLGTAHGLVHLAIGLMAVGMFVVGLAIWFATGNVIAPPAIWLLFAVFGALMDHGPIPHHAVEAVEFGVALLAVAALAMHLARHVHYAARRREANRYLQHATLGPEPAIADRSDEMRMEDVKRMRFLLDRALQPVEAFEGFEWLDQFQTAAVRYQINFIGYALSMAQATHLPAFGGYLNTAQQRLSTSRPIINLALLGARKSLGQSFARSRSGAAREHHVHRLRRDADGDVSGRFGTARLRPRRQLCAPASGRAPLRLRFRRPGRCARPRAAALGLRARRLRAELDLSALQHHWRRRHDGARPDAWGPPFAPLAAPFRERLEDEFIDLAGRFVPCRSNYSGCGVADDRRCAAAGDAVLFSERHIPTSHSGNGCCCGVDWCGTAARA